MKVYALEGRSGTGKSYQALNLCREKNIESIIDDGLYIYRNEAVAGTSAKREPTKIGAIKTALFTDTEHRDDVIKKISETSPVSILVIGTSEDMCQRIRKRLGLPDIDETIHIEDITTEGEREIAQKQRKNQGEHVVPAPTFQLKRQFSGYLMSPLRMIRGLGFGRDTEEKSVVRPTYSYLGEYSISDRVVSDIVAYETEDISEVDSVTRVITEKHKDGLRVTVLMTLALGVDVIEVCRAVQKRCRDTIEEMTAFNMDRIDIEVRGLV